MEDSKKDEGRSKTADTHKMSPEEVRPPGVEAPKQPPGHHPAEVLHQRGRLPISYPTMAALAGITIASVIGYAAFYSKKNKSEANAPDAARVATNVAPSEEVTRGRK